MDEPPNGSDNGGLAAAIFAAWIIGESYRRVAREATLPRRFPRVSDRWQDLEREVCEERGERHLGGPARPDCVGTRTVTEVKATHRPAGQRAVQQAYMKAVTHGGRPVLVSHSGFTSPARDVAGLLDVELIQRSYRLGRGG